MATVRTRVMRTAVAGIVFAVLLAVAPKRSAHAQNTEIESSMRFADTLRLTASKALHVEFRDWNVTRSARGTELPLQGFYIAHLASADVITEISGKSETRHAGDFWTVGKGERMLVRIKAPRESVIIQTLVVEPSR